MHASGLDIRLTPVRTLLLAGASSRANPEQSDVEKEILRMEGAAKRARKKAAAEPFSGASVRKYLIAAAILTAASFFTGYPLYYRLLAGVCMTLFVGSAAISRRRA